jgi:hypothetical protein
MLSNAILSPADDRDYPVTAALDISSDPIPEDYEVWQPPTLENQKAGNCVAQVIANILECIEYQRSGEHKDYSVGGIYAKSSVSPAAGMIMRDACKAVLAEGDVLRSDWECDEENPMCRNLWLSLPQEIRDKAKKLISAYIRINTKEELQRYMMRYKLPVMISAKTADYHPLAGSGYHATACYGWMSEETYDREYGGWEYEDLRYTNSWGAFNSKSAINFIKLREIWGFIPIMAEEEKKFADIDGHWAEKFIDRCRELGLVNGYEDNTVRPENSIKRGEACKMFAQLADKALDEIEKLKTDHNSRLERLEKMFGIK